MARSKIYTGYWSQMLAAGGFIDSTFRINTPGREIKIKRIHLIDEIRNAANNIFNQNTLRTQQIELRVGSLPPGGILPQIAQPFESLGGTALTSTGQYFSLVSPGEYNFQNFFLANELIFRLIINNREAATAYNHQVFVIVEIDEKISYPV